MVHFCYKGGRGICEHMHIKAFKIRAGLCIDIEPV